MQAASQFKDESSRDMFASSFNFVEKNIFSTKSLHRSAGKRSDCFGWISRVYPRCAFLLFDLVRFVAEISIFIWQPFKYCFLRFWRLLIDDQSLRVEITAENCLPTLCYWLKESMVIYRERIDKITHRKIVKEGIFTGINFTSSRSWSYFFRVEFHGVNCKWNKREKVTFLFFEIYRSITLFCFRCQIFRCFPCSCLFLEQNSPKPIFDRKNKISCSYHIEGLSSA